MDTIVIKLNQPEKAKLLMEMMKSMDFITIVQYFDKYVNARRLLEEINKIAAASPLAQLSPEAIDKEIHDYRNGK